MEPYHDKDQLEEEQEEEEEKETGEITINQAF
jgi:hypothetical protein